MVTHLPLLSMDECAYALERIEAHRAAWTQRYPGLPAYTLGAASYLDSAPGRHDAYYAKAAAMNPLLEREFGWLYERLLETLGTYLGAGVTFEPRAARPGFHIFLAHEAFKQALGKAHFDLQFMNLEWPDGGGIDFSRPVSYTLAIRLPEAGAGLHTWSMAKAEYDAMDPAARDRIDRERIPEYVPYREGTMVCHSGMLLHQIAPATGNLQPGDMRVTLQGHALPGPHGYRLYW